ncbi:GNAT family N-acetyltransferase [Myroides odoratus]|uniref:GNAT family N-acetyltransferase n=1 Tax=Myroides odoratus TaxID=256 RepID=UPI000765DD3B|nr:GNAT family N-acetyltransferase [Myroides odoratus]
MEIKHEQNDSKGAFTAWIDGKKAGEMTYSVAGTSMIIVDATHVDEAFKGQGVGQKLLQEGVVPFARAKGVKVMPLCPFAKAMFDRHAELADLRA